MPVRAVEAATVGSADSSEALADTFAPVRALKTSDNTVNRAIANRQILNPCERDTCMNQTPFFEISMLCFPQRICNQCAAKKDPQHVNMLSQSSIARARWVWTDLQWCFMAIQERLCREAIGCRCSRYDGLCAQCGARMILGRSSGSPKLYFSKVSCIAKEIKQTSRHRKRHRTIRIS